MSRSQSQKRKYTSARERAEKQSTGFTAACLKIPDGVTMFKPKPGTMLIDILPYVAGEGNPWADDGNLHWERTYYVHRGIGANSDMVLCPRMTSKERCPICEHRMKLVKEGDEDNEDLIKDLSPKQRQLFNVINLKDPDKGIQLWDISYHLFGKLLDARLRNSEEEDEWDKFFFLENGLTLKVGFEEKTFGGRTFCEVETIDFKQRKEDYDEDMLDKAHCLDEILIEEEYDDLKKTFLETRDEEDEDEDKPRRKVKDDDVEDEEEETPRRKRRHKEEEEPEEEEDEEPPKKKKKAPSDEEDDWGDFDEDEDEDKSKKKKKADEDEPEEEEEERPRRKHKDRDEEEEEEDKPKRSRFGRDKGEEDDGWDDPDDTEKEMKRRKKDRE